MHAELFPETPWYIFPENPWYKGSDSRPSSLAGLYASHLVVGTQFEGFPLSSIYHVLRHLRGKPLLESQILIGEDKSLTLALRRFNYPLNCTGEGLPPDFLNEAPKGEGREAVKELWQRMNGNDRLPHIPATMGCFPGWFRKVLHWLDLAELPVGGEERIANVTAGSDLKGDLRGDARLTAALQLAALQAMERLSPERMALYYDNAGAYLSAPVYFQKSLPELLDEAIHAPLTLEEFSRQKLANALIRSGDFEGDETCSNRETCNLGDKSGHAAYLTADRILPNDLSIQARIGYGFLINARQLTWKQKSECVALQKCVDKQQLLSLATMYLEKAIASDQDTAVRRYGRQRVQSILAWAYANLAYARALQGEASGSSTQNFKDALDAANHALKADGADLRAKIARAYVLALQRDCSGAMQQLEAKGSRPSENYTLHNNILMEEQLGKIFYACEQTEPGQLSLHANRHPNPEMPIAVKHEVLLDSLISLTYLQKNLIIPSPLEALINSKQDQLSNDLLQATQFRVAFYEYSALSNQPNAESKASGLCSTKDFSRLSRDDRWRARSLCARIEAMGCRNLEDSSALAAAKEASERIPDDPHLMANLGIVRLKGGDPSSAVTDFRAAISMDTREPQLRYLLGYTLQALKREVEGKREMGYGKLLDSEGWKHIVEHYQTNSIDACVAPSNRSRSVAPQDSADRADEGIQSDPGTEATSAIHHRRPKGKNANGR